MLQRTARRYRLEWILLGVALLALGALIGAWIHAEHDQIESMERDRLQVQARVIDDNLGRQLEGVNHALAGIRDDLTQWNGAMMTVSPSRRLTVLTNVMLGVRTLLIADAKGTILDSNRNELIGRNFSERDYFRVPRARPDPDRLYVSPPFKTVLGVVAINVTRAVAGPGGEFAGIVSATLDPNYFNVLLRSVLYAPDMRAVLVHWDGKAFVFMPPNQLMVGADLARPGSLFSRHRESGQSATLVTGTSILTREERMTASRTFGRAGAPMDKPLVIQVSRELSAMYLPWRRESLIYGVLYGLFALAAVLGLYFLQRRRRILDRLALVHENERKRAEAERAFLEAQLRESQKMEALGTLAGGVAHDFNNIVATIMGNAELAQQDVGPGHAAQESLEEIRKASIRAKDLVQQILAFGRRQVLEPQVISLAPVVRESARLLRSTLPAGVSLKVECAPDAPVVLADATQVQQVLLNLCTNAWQAMQGQARPAAIEISLTPYQEDGAPYAGSERRTSEGRVALRPGRYACLMVCDTGPGMDPATRTRIFEPFFTTKPVGKGTGLGLAVVHGIVQGHGASIAVHSAPGEGASFRIYFPAAPAAPALQARAEPRVAQKQDGAAPALRAKGISILYVDDDEGVVLMMTRLLERQGYRVRGYTDPREALAAVRSQPDAFDLVVTDYNMPRLSGLELAQALREIRAGLPVALASGYITEELRAQVSAAGVRELICKADTADALCDAVARLASDLPV